MLFNSLSFAIFFPIVTILYFAIPHRIRWCMLLAASCAFYMAFIPEYIFILLVTIVIDYSAGLLIDAEKNSKKRRLYLIISIISTCAVLFIFKYFNFFNENIANLARLLHWNYPIEALKIILPIGLSFHTFQSLSYVIEVYKGRQQAERHFGIYALYVMFYPQLVAGPIERPQNLLHQFYARHYFDAERVADGLRLMLWGFVKKVVIADRLAVFVNEVYGSPSNFADRPAMLVTATCFFAFQIYNDFSGYTDIARGAAKVMGFNLMENFRSPYFAKSVPEFWRRWHMSLSTWFKDYVYIPLGGNRVPKHRQYINLLITFLLSGVWHGANWTFVVWGALNGVFIVLSNVTQNLREKLVSITRINKLPILHKCIQIAVTFTLICLAWVFFRAKNVSDAIYIITHIFDGLKNLEGCINDFNAIVNANLITFILIWVMILLHMVRRHAEAKRILYAMPIWARWTAYYIVIAAILLLGMFTHQEFIYFQF